MVYWHLRRTLNRTVGSEDNKEFEKRRFVPAINLANFLKTNVEKFAALIWVKKGQKTGFFAPDKLETRENAHSLLLEINNSKGKEKEEK